MIKDMYIGFWARNVEERLLKNKLAEKHYERVMRCLNKPNQLKALNTITKQWEEIDIKEFTK